MNKNVPASFGLSVVIVLFFAVILYQPDPPPSKAGAVEKTAASDPSQPPQTKPGEAAVATAAVAGKPIASTLKAPKRDARPIIMPVAVVVERPKETATARRVVIPDPPNEPKGAFTHARAGESLTDVAQRVYGDADQDKKLWLVNRDVLDRADAPLRPGMLLRTP